MRKILMFAATLLVVAPMALPAMAQGYNSGITQTEINNFNNYLRNHPKTAQELAANPSLAKNPNFYSQHPGLESFLANHPGVREELNHNPGQFMRSENGGYQWQHGGWQGHGAPGGPQNGWPGGPQAGWHGGGPGSMGGGSGAVGGFNNGYLSQHPDVAQQLAQDPKLVDDPQFRATHPGLDQYLAEHPQVRQQLQQHPERFMAAEHRMRKHERHQEHYQQNHS